MTSSLPSSRQPRRQGWGPAEAVCRLAPLLQPGFRGRSPHGRIKDEMGTGLGKWDGLGLTLQPPLQVV